MDAYQLISRCMALFPEISFEASESAPSLYLMASSCIYILVILYIPGSWFWLKFLKLVWFWPPYFLSFEFILLLILSLNTLEKQFTQWKPWHPEPFLYQPTHPTSTYINMYNRTNKWFDILKFVLYSEHHRDLQTMGTIIENSK